MAVAEKVEYKTFQEFWPHYLSVHKKRETRLLHICGTILAGLAIFKAIISFKIGWLFVAPIVGYGFAWGAHAFVEDNRPVTFEHPLWSLRGDLELLKLWATGQLEAELSRHQIMT